MSTSPVLRREIGVRSLALIAIGACIGSGIFLTPSDIAQKVPAETGILLAWVIGGMVALTGSLTFAELGSRIDADGGVYAYLRACYGDVVAFLYGWVTLTVITSGAIAALVLACARYLDYIWPIGQEGIPIAGSILLILLTWINVRGVKAGASVASSLTIMKVAGILVILAAGGWYWYHPTALVQVSPEREWSVSGVGLALVGVFWSYGGWHHASYLAGEAIQPSRTVPRAMVIGALVVTSIYVATNWAYLQLLGPEGMADSSAVAADALGRLLEQGGLFIAILIMVSTLGTASIYTLSAPRIYFSMSRDGSFFPQLSRIHPTFRTPHVAILLQSGWAMILLWFWSTFENLIAYVVFMDVFFMVMAAAGLFILRHRSSGMSMYIVPLYPLVPMLYIGINLWFLVTLLLNQPDQAWAGLLLCAIGIPLFLWFRRQPPVVTE